MVSNKIPVMSNTFTSTEVLFYVMCLACFIGHTNKYSTVLILALGTCGFQSKTRKVRFQIGLSNCYIDSFAKYRDKINK